MSIEYNIKIPKGRYSLNDINLQFVILTSNLYVKGLFYVEGIEATSQCIVYCNDYANTQINFESNNDNIFDVLGFVSTSNKFIPQSITQYALSPNNVSIVPHPLFLDMCLSNSDMCIYIIYLDKINL